MTPSSRYGTLRGATDTFLEMLAGSAGLVLGFVAPIAGVGGVAWLVDYVEERRRGRPVFIEVRADDLPAYHLAILKPGETSWLPPNLLADLRKAQKVTVKRRADVR